MKIFQRKKTKIDNMVLNVTKISQKIKNKNLFRIENNVLE